MRLLDFLAPYKTIIEVSLLLAALSFVAIEVHRFMDHQQDIGYQRAVAEYKEKAALVAEANARIESALKTQLKDSQNAAAKREAELQAMVVSSGATSASLRNTLATINANLPGATVDALRATASSLGYVFEECRSRRSSLAAEAERLNSEKRTLIEAWPQ